jgi:HEAT repeat protein
MSEQKNEEKEDALTLFIDALEDRSVVVRQRAVHELSTSDSERVVAPLIAALRDSTLQIRDEALKGLSYHGDTSILNALGPMFINSDGYLRQQLRETFRDVAIRSANKQVLVYSDVFRRCVLPEDENCSAGGRCAIKYINSNAVKVLVEVFDKADIVSQPEIFDILKMFEDQQIQNFVIKKFADPSPWIRNLALLHGSQFFGPEIIPQLMTLAEDSDVKVRVSALEALSKFIDSRVDKIYKRALQDQSDEVRRKAASAISSMSGRVSPSAPNPCR